MDNQILLTSNIQEPQVLLPVNTFSEEVHQKFPKIPPDTKCNGKVHRQLRYCKKPAGWGTKHFGNGRCKLHGGCSTGRKSGNLRYSDFVPSALVEKYEEFSVEDNASILSLDSEIALLRAKLTGIENINQKGEFDSKVLQTIELLRRLIETKQKCEEGLKSKVTIEFTGQLIDSIVKIIDESISDIEVKKCIANKMRRLNEVQLGLSRLN